VSHRKALPDKGAQVWLARQLEAGIPSAAAPGQGMGALAVIGAVPLPGGPGVAPQLRLMVAAERPR
jgi:hypothetical protein